MRKLLTLLALTAIVPLAGACGPSEDGSSPAKNPAEKGAAGKVEAPTPVEMVRVAYRDTAAEETAKTAFEVTTTSPPVDPENGGGPAPMVLTVEGNGVTNFSGTESAVTASMLGMDGFEARQLDGMLYMKFPEGARPPEASGAKSWIRVSADEAYDHGGASLMGTPGDDASNPARQLEYLRAVSESVEKAGQERVRGVRTTRYKATMDLHKEAAGQDAETREAYDRMIGQLGTSKVPVEVWIDGQNLARRVAIDMIVPGHESSAAPGEPGRDKTRLSMVTEYYDFGTPVDVQAPPPEETMDGSKLLPGGQPDAR